MFNRLFELLGMSDDYDDEDVVITSHQDDVNNVDKRISEEIDKRAERLKKPMPSRPDMILCRGEGCVELMDDMISALKQGRIVLLDFKGVNDVEGGQKTLNRLYETVSSMRGALIRVSKTVFLATPIKSACEEWIIEEEKNPSIKETKDGE